MTAIAPDIDRARGRIGLGAMDLSEPGVAHTEARAVLLRAIELGADLIDTADRYGSGHNEQLLGRVLAGRPEARIGTKIGFVGKPGDPRPVDNRPEHLRRACTASLRRLAVDQADLLTLHRVDPAVPLEESVGTLDALRREGLTRRIGVSEVGPVTLRAAHAVAPIDAVQIEYSLASREPGDQVLATARELGIEVHASSPLGIGLLTRTATELLSPGGTGLLHRRLQTTPRAAEGVRRHNATLLQRLRRLADEVGCSASQLALAWLTRRGPEVVALPGTRRVDHLEANLDVRDLVLSADVVRTLDELFPPGVFHGARKADPALALTLP